MKDIYDYSAKKIYTFDKLKELYNVPNNDFLKYLSLVQSISNFWKLQLKHENGRPNQNDVVKPTSSSKTNK